MPTISEINQVSARRNSSDPNISDAPARKKAIDPRASFVVQAPAGSGKTELLTQRYLQLLTHTKKAPEEIFAITFTRKAASEMRQRILGALNQAATQPKPQQPHEQLTWTLAKAALQHDTQHHWRLLENPNRLRILTFDALAAYLVKQMPLSAQFSTKLKIIDHPHSYYREATEAILLSLADNHPWKEAIETLLLHLDNRVYLLADLLIAILSKRDQWLPHIMPHQADMGALKAHLDAALSRLTLETIQSAQEQLPPHLESELIALAHYAGTYCSQHDPLNPVAQCKGLTQLTPEIDSLPQWLGIAQLLLTQKGSWRRSITKRQGFPVSGNSPADRKAFKAMKQRIQALLTALAEQTAFQNCLDAISCLPPTAYSDDQWTIIKALLQLLPLLVAQLNLIFSRDSATDFIELNLAALRALGNPENPTDLVLNLDYLITHLLIDEFQDTSVVQFELIERLIAGWEPDDGRTIFLVGDPMQSIYRFRNAEVGLFLRAQQHGIGAIRLQALTLTQNFRSAPHIVTWNNNTFGPIFTASFKTTADELTAGAIPYTPSYSNVTRKKEVCPNNIHWYPSFNDDGRQEAEHLIALIKKLQQSCPNDSVAILVRSRNHLNHLTPALHHHLIPFQAIDLEPLADAIEIQDIHILARALLHRADRIAWLAILRAPYCGLRLADLLIIAQAADHHSIYATLKNYQQLNQLSAEAIRRLQHCVPILCEAVENKGRYSLSEMLLRLWNTLGGPHTMTKPHKLINIQHYIKLIEKLELHHQPLSLTIINEGLQKLFAQPLASTTTQLQIMTIHKAKGLEFDHVILPGLQRKTPADRRQLLRWLERPSRWGANDLILAPIQPIDTGDDAIYTYLSRIETLKSQHERARLLYVATTRAKKSLHLLANVNIKDDDNLKDPDPRSFLSLLWHRAAGSFNNALKIRERKNTEMDHSEQQQCAAQSLLTRFNNDYFENQPDLPIPTVTAHSSVGVTSKRAPIDSDRHRIQTRIIGTVIHEILEQIAHESLTAWPLAACEKKIKPWQNRLNELGIMADELDSCLGEVLLAIQQTLTDHRGQWILAATHTHAYNEFAINIFENNVLKKLIIDRCFVDDNNIRWIIDYKTTREPGLEQQHHKLQLESYAHALSQLENRSIRLGLYYPLASNHWLEWAPSFRT